MAAHTYDPEVREALLRGMRQRRHRDRANLSPTERLEWMEQLRELAFSCRDLRPTRKSRRDEPPELWLRMLKRWRALDPPAR